MIARGLIIGMLFLFMAVTGCQDELEDRYLNPDKATAPSIDKFFTAILNSDRVRPSYWDISTFMNWHIGVYSQAVAFLNNETIYQQNESYIQDRWNDFYRPSANGSGIVALYREIEKTYEGLSESEKQNNLVFVNAARVVLFDQVCQMVDYWGDVPFSDAGMLNRNGEVVYPRFDKAADIYADAIAGLKELGDYFASVRLSSSSASAFIRQDILLGGDVEQWRRYTNSLRLRLLMRLSFYSEAAVREEVMTLLSDPVQYPLLGDGNYHPADDDVLLAALPSYTDNLSFAFNDWDNFPAPWYALENVLKPAGDPRIPVMFDKYGTTINNSFQPNTEFNAMPLDLSTNEQQASVGKYAVLDSTTFLFNSKLPGVVFTVSEVNFLKAEAFERWGGGDPEVEFKNGVANSIIFYYYLNNLNPSGKKLVTPSDEAIQTFISDSEFLAYQGEASQKLEKILTQKWLHFGFLQAGQRWAELRRTNIPTLEFYESSLPGYEQPPARLTYPLSEKTFNLNYQTVAVEDTRTHKIFWDVN